MDTNNGKKIELSDKLINNSQNKVTKDDNQENISEIKKEWKKKQRRAYQKSHIQEKRIRQSRNLFKTIFYFVGIVGTGTFFIYLLSPWNKLENGIAVKELNSVGDNLMGVDSNVDGNNINSLNDVCESQNNKSCVGADNISKGGMGKVIDNIQKINQTSKKNNEKLDAVIKISDGK